MPTLINLIDGQEYAVQAHDVNYQPPNYIGECKARSREVTLNGARTPFYFGRSDANTRVTFQWGDTWFFVDADHRGNPNLNIQLWNLDNKFAFSFEEDVAARP